MTSVIGDPRPGQVHAIPTDTEVDATEAVAPQTGRLRLDSISTYQAEIVPWVKKNFTRTNLSAIGGLTEEVGEVARCAVKAQQGIRGTYEEWMAEMRKELGDVFIKLVEVADFFGHDLESCVADRWDVISQRDWTTDRIGHGI